MSQIIVENSPTEIIKIEVPQKFLLEQLKSMRLRKELLPDDAIYHPQIVIKNLYSFDEDYASNFKFGFHYIDNMLKGKKKKSLEDLDVRDQFISSDVQNITLRASSNIF